MALPQVVLPTFELEIPSNKKKIKYRPFVVKEEKLLLLAMEGGNDKEIEDAVKQLLKGCIQSRVKLDDLAIFDLEYIFLRIRAASVGEIVEMNITCQDDGETVVKYNLDLSDVKVTYPDGHSNKIMLSENLGVIMKYPSFREFVDGSVLGKMPDAENLLEIIGGCIDQIFDGEDVYDSSTTTKKEFVQFLESLSNKQFESIQGFFETSPSLEHQISVKNPKTGEITNVTISGLSNFFG